MNWIDCINQERRYTDGWRARLAGELMPLDPFGMMGWIDANKALEKGRTL